MLTGDITPSNRTPSNGCDPDGPGKDASGTQMDDDADAKTNVTTVVEEQVSAQQVNETPPSIEVKANAESEVKMSRHAPIEKEVIPAHRVPRMLLGEITPTNRTCEADAKTNLAAVVKEQVSAQQIDGAPPKPHKSRRTRSHK